ncbi:MAG: hypothetical protein GYB34_12300 [Gammaproteobacteria bacterium]|nr:hypothetical protein [Gammaproteobacteria bacterium]|tara:strand:- start:2914 stop:4371 length:1458 start_codon:yes stop_codon:yes gene_type:complete
MKHSNKFRVQFVFLSLLSTNAIAQEVPNIFSPSTPAKAAEVNENFDFLYQKLRELESSSIGFTVKEGKEVFNVDCTDNPAALNELYVEKRYLSDLHFIITGQCYGNITVNRNAVDQDGMWTNETYFAANQTITIEGEENGNAVLIPNDLSGLVAQWASSGSGINILNLTMQMGENDYAAVSVSKNGHASVHGVTINGPDSIGGIGINAMEGGQVYISYSTISKTDKAILGTNGAAIRLVGPNTIVGGKGGIQLTNSTLRMNDTQTIGGSDYSLELYNTASFNGFGNNVEITEGFIRIVANSTFQADDVNAPNSNMWLNTSLFQIYGNLNLASMNMGTSQLSAVGGAIGGTTNLWDNSSATFTGVTLDGLSVWSSQARVSDTSINNLLIHSGGVDIVNVNINNEIEASQRAIGFFNNVSSPKVNAYADAYLNFYGDNKPATSGLSCDAAFITYEGISMLTDLPDSGCIDHGILNELRALILEHNSQ